MKKSFLMTFAQFMNKLSNIDWTTPDGESMVSSDKSLKSKKGNWELQYSYEEMTSLHDRSVPIRIVIHLWFNGEHITQWGCEDNEQNALFIEWFIKQRNKINDELYEEEKAVRKTGEDMWNNL